MADKDHPRERQSTTSCHAEPKTKPASSNKPESIKNPPLASKHSLSSSVAYTANSSMSTTSARSRYDSSLERVDSWLNTSHGYGFGARLNNMTATAERVLRELQRTATQDALTRQGTLRASRRDEMEIKKELTGIGAWALAKEGTKGRGGYLSSESKTKSSCTTHRK